MAVAISLSLSRDPLKALLQYLETSFGQAILEGVEDICFVGVGRAPDHFHFDAAFDLGQWERGRAFGEEMELRWRRRGSRYALLLISENAVSLPPHLTEGIDPFPEPIPLEQLPDDPPLHIILWGSWQDPEAEPDLPISQRPFWYEAQVPRFLAYPCDQPEPYRNDRPKPRPAIRISRYRTLQTDPQAPNRSQEQDDLQGSDGPEDLIYRFVSVGTVATEAVAAEETPGSSREEEPT